MAYEGENQELPYTPIETDDARRMVEAGVRIIDVRQPEEWNQGHIPEAQLVPINDAYSFGEVLKGLHLPKNEAVIFICRSGKRSATASEIAYQLGFNQIYNLENGMLGWVEHKYPTER